MSEHFKAPALLRRIGDYVAEYEQKRGAIPAALSEFKQHVTDLESAANIGGAFGGGIWSGRYNSAPSVSEGDMSAALLTSAWRHVMAFPEISTRLTAKDRSQLETSMTNPPEFTLDNIRATFGKYLIDPRSHILRGVAEAFCDLDPAYKSHSKVKIGVSGLPKRAILNDALPEYGGGWREKILEDVLNAVATLHGEPRLEYAELDALKKAARRGDDPDFYGITLRGFKNGNCHLIFDREAQDHINRALAEYYGDVLPDTPDEPTAKRPGTDLAKDLQFYPTPAAAAQAMIARMALSDGFKVLEPSCGEGAMMDALHATGKRLQVTGVECHPGRADAARAKGHHVQTANFLQIAPSPIFDVVMMNPPFYGRHYQKHVEHARKFLKPGGTVYAILPITAATDHGYIHEPRHNWFDLPVGTFSESGTNINTGIATFSHA